MSSVFSYTVEESWSDSGLPPPTSTSDHEDEESDETSSDDDGVFLGPRQSNELKILAKLSASVSSPLQAIHRVKKRDSREFLRRRTILSTPSTRPRESAQDREESDSSCSSPVQPTSSFTPNKALQDSDLTLRLSSFHFSTPQPDRSELLVGDEGSDKENISPRTSENDDPSIHLAASAEHIVSIGQDAINLEDSDDDPETGLEEVAERKALDNGEDIDSISLRDVEDPSSSPTPKAKTSPSPSTDSLDSPLPLARAGPVVIPVLTTHHFTSLRAETGSPCRPLLLATAEVPIAESDDTCFNLAPIDSPPRDVSTTAATPSCATTLPPPELVERGARLLKSSTSKPSTLPRSGQSVARVLTIRNQLDSALSSRISSLGPPQRSVPAFNSSVSSSSNKPVLEPLRTFKKPLSRPHIAPLAHATARSVTRPALAPKSSVPRPKITTLIKPSVPSSSIPQKRPIAHSQFVRSTPLPTPVASRLPSGAPASRLTLGQPSRLMKDAQPASIQLAPVFSIGVAGETQVIARPEFRSPAKLGLFRRSTMDRGTPKKVTSATAREVSTLADTVTTGPPSSATRSATEDKVASPTPVRGSSEDHEEVSTVLQKPPSSPKSPSPRGKSSRRPKRATKSGPPPKMILPTSIVPNMSEKELKAATQRNTMRNQVYHCAIDRQIIRQAGPRPPSPTSKIRTTAEKDEEEKRHAREDRARRRKGEEDGMERPVVEKFTQTRGPGDDEDFVTPARPTKKAKTDDKTVKWDREVLIIPLDKHGNVLESHRPVDNLKRTRIVVTAVFYEGEEPVPAPSSATRSKKK
ncbi:hypothetical protein IAR55_004040 [Kwoniella newhampshirensis]|uniref:Uncharacterized protein n=1 Tax=Kwoniella newhampshirensis TaxID=1651941 RepID=A0AAW0YLJ4_9TREE